jgi:CRP-like cAMP-binding protein
MRARLAEYLLNAPSDSSGRVKLDITKRALALHLGTQPETLSRVLSAMQAGGILGVRGRIIEIIDAEKLEQAAGGE